MREPVMHLTQRDLVRPALLAWLFPAGDEPERGLGIRNDGLVAELTRHHVDTHLSHASLHPGNRHATM